MTIHESRTMARTTLDDALGFRPDYIGAPDWTVTTEVPLADAGSSLGPRWNPLDIAVSAVVDTARNGPLTVRHGDSDDPGIPRVGSRAEGAIMAAGADGIAAPEG